MKQLNEKYSLCYRMMCNHKNCKVVKRLKKRWITFNSLMDFKDRFGNHLLAADGQALIDKLFP